MTIDRWRRLRRAFATLACAGGLAAGLTACGDDADSTATAGGGGDSGDAVTLAMITSGSHTDSSFVQSWWAGAEQARRALGDKARITWTDGLNSLDALDRGAGAALTEGNRYLIFSTSEAPQLVTEYAEKFPDAFVCGLETPRESYPDNLCTFMPRYWEGAFLAGALAGLTTRTNKIGVVSAFDIPIQNLQVEGFVLGARYVNPDIKIERATTESLIDSGRGRAAAQAQYANGVDIILSAIDDATQGIFLAARRAGGYVIPQYTDQYDAAPDVVLTSVVYHHDSIGAKLIETAVAGELEPRSYEFGLAELGVGELAPFRGKPGEIVTEDVRKRLEELRSQIEDGTIVLPGPEVFARRGAGEEIDLDSLRAGS